jgi:hypothetical protein
MGIFGREGWWNQYTGVIAFGKFSKSRKSLRVPLIFTEFFGLKYCVYPLIPSYSHELSAVLINRKKFLKLWKIRVFMLDIYFLVVGNDYVAMLNIFFCSRN